MKPLCRQICSQGVKSLECRCGYVFLDQENPVQVNESACLEKSGANSMYLDGNVSPARTGLMSDFSGGRKTLCRTQKIAQSSFTSAALYLEVKWLWPWPEHSSKRKQKLAKCEVKMFMQNQTHLFKGFFF